MATATTGPDDALPLAVGIVVIGRNEGERLRRCLVSLGPLVRRAVYVDSGSKDDSVAFARSLGAQVVELDPAIAFTAARARNAGFAALAASGQPVDCVQFVDGDCEVEPGWLRRAAEELAAHPDLAVVFGRRRERAREASAYNRLCDLEWDVPPGDAASCGGDALMRAAAFQASGGYREELIAGEEPELCLRLRERGWRIRRIDAPMTVHDAAMHRFGQWWRRAVRSGYTVAEGRVLAGRRHPRHRDAPRLLFWVVGLPLLAVGFAVWGAASGRPAVAWAALAALVAAHGVAFWRIVRREQGRWPPADVRLYASFCVLAKWPEAQGMATYWWRRLCGKQRRLIEYKGAEDRGAEDRGAARR